MLTNQNLISNITEYICFSHTKYIENFSMIVIFKDKNIFQWKK